LIEHEQKKLYCYLYPFQEECIRSFARELSADKKDFEKNVELLREAKELCSKPDLNLETYIYDNKVDIKNFIVDENQD
jgi:hypothetical protein